MNNDNKQIRNITIIGFLVNAVLSVFKLIAGFVGRSAAMIADGVHSLSDFLTDIVVLIGIKLKSRPEDECHNYGHDKYETLATAVISLFLIIVGFEICKSGIKNIIFIINGGIIPAPSRIALIAAALSIIVKELLYRYTIYRSKRINSNLLKANAWHHRSDALSSIGTLIGISAAIFLGDKWTVLDPVASVIVSIFIFKVAYQILKPAIDELLEKSLPEKDKEIIIDIINSHPSTMGYHHLRTRSLGRRCAVEAHVFVDKEISVEKSHNIATELEKSIREVLIGELLITIHIEPYTEERAMKK